MRRQTQLAAAAVLALLSGLLSAAAAPAPVPAVAAAPAPPPADPPPTAPIVLLLPPIPGAAPDPAPASVTAERAPPSSSRKPAVKVDSVRGAGRMTLPALDRGRYAISVAGQRVTVRVSAPVAFAPLRGQLRNAASLSISPGLIEVVAVPGSAVRVISPGRRPVLELSDPPPPVPVAAVLVPAPPPVVSVGPLALPASAGPPPAGSVLQFLLPDREDASSAQGGSVSVGGTEDVGLAPPRASAVPPPPVVEVVPGAADPSILIPAARGVGLAAFRSASDTIFVLDAPMPLQVPRGGLGAAFAGLSASRTQDATVLRVSGGDRAFRMSRGARGWVVSAGEPLLAPEPIPVSVVRDGAIPPSVRFVASEPSRVVRVMDPATGALLLVGTQTVPGQFVPRRRTWPQFVIMPTLQGVAVDPGSDDLQMRPVADGFDLAGGPGTLGGINSSAASLPPPGTSPPPAMSRAFAFPVDTVQGLRATLVRRVSDAGAAPSLSRSTPRQAVAESMLALGMGAEAQGVLEAAAADDPPFAARPPFLALRGAAALLAGRLGEAGPLFDPAVDGSEEAEVWRSLARVARDEVSPEDARTLARGLPIVLSYPAPLRGRLLPGALEAMVAGGQAVAAAAALKSLSDPGLSLARAMAAEAAGDLGGAAAEYDAVAAGPDRLARYKALLRRTEMQLKAGALDPRSAADALDRALYTWRGERQEAALRMRVADLRRRAGEWREALAVLRDGRDALPDDRASLDREISATFVALVSGGGVGRMDPADLVALYDRDRELVQGIAWDEALGIRFVERLVTLGLQGRAEPVMAGLVARAADDGRRAFLGLRLASLRMTTDDSSGAIAALADTAPPPGLPVDPVLSAARQLLYARAESERGAKDRALSMLGALDSEEADQARADIHAARADWSRAVGALASIERRRGLGPSLDPEGRALVSRLAVAATLADDRATLDRLAASYGPAMAAVPSGAVFRLMTGRPVTATADLPRAFDEMRTARDVRSALVPAPLPANFP